MKKIDDSPLVARLIALFLALTLFFYVNLDKADNTRQTGSNEISELANYSETVTVPLKIKADNDRYFITGYPQKVNVKLSGPKAMVVSAINNQNFIVSADLTKLKVGTHEVKLSIDGVNKDVKATSDPKTIKVTLAVRATRELPVQTKINTDNLAEGYKTGNPILSQDVVTVSGSKSAVNSVTHIVAAIEPNKNTKTDINQEVLLQALDMNDKPVNVLISPQTINVRVKVYLSSKTVDLKLKQTGTPVDGYTYELKTDQQTLKLYGSLTALKKYSSLTVDVDVSDIKETTEKDVSIVVPKTLNSSYPQTIKVKITVKKTAESESSESSKSNDASSSSSESSSSKESTTESASE